MTSQPPLDRAEKQNSVNDDVGNDLPARLSPCTAVQALIRWGRNPSDDSRRLTALQRSELIALAEALTDPTLALHRIDRAKLGRVQALYIAEMIGCFDAPLAPSPFKSKALTCAYINQQNRLRSL